MTLPSSEPGAAPAGRVPTEPVVPERFPRSGRSHVRLALRLSAGALLGKLLGFGRELLFARLLGVGLLADSYRGAVTATLLPIAPLQGDMIPSVLIPLHRDWNAQGIACRMFTPLMAIFGLIALSLGGLVAACAGWWVDLLLPGFSPAAHATTVAMLHWMAVGMPASVLLNCLSSIEISVGRARITTARAAVQNVATIAGVLALVVTGQPACLGISFAVGFWLLLLVGGALLWREGEIRFGDLRPAAGVVAFRAFFGRLKPLLIQPLADQVNTFVERIAASLVGGGMLAALDYAHTLTETAQYMVGQPIGFSVLAADAPRPQDLRARIAMFARPLLALALPASLYLAFFAPDLVRLIYERGAFGTDGVALTSGSLRGISCGLWAGTLGYVLLQMLNSAARNGAVARVLFAGYLVNIVLNLTVPHLLGPLGIGLGEGARGVSVLIGASIVLGCPGLIAGLVGRALLPTLGLGVVFIAIRWLGLGGPSTLLLAASAAAVVGAGGIGPEIMLLFRRLRPVGA